MTDAREVRVSRYIEATPGTVFGILSDPARFSEWIQGEASFEPRAGSELTIHFPNFDTVVAGEVLEVVPDERLVLSWGVSEGRQAEWFPTGSSTVSFELRPEGEGTRVELVHADLPTEKEVEQHRAGWRFHAGRLDLVANRAEVGERLPDVLDAWCAAWSEPDDADRAKLLERCCANDVHYADEWATLDGRERLSLHIANSIRFMPGARLALKREPTICRGEVLAVWTVGPAVENPAGSGRKAEEEGADGAGRDDGEGGATGDGGAPRMEGILHARVGLDGRIRSATSFLGA